MPNEIEEEGEGEEGVVAEEGVATEEGRAQDKYPKQSEGKLNLDFFL